ncbi:hypothetical protein AGMMS50284_1360 [Clostridia bacterium]|nr:hypothetical protein AGMMS50284_1360 [Clostridia bacterium]
MEKKTEKRKLVNRTRPVRIIVQVTDEEKAEIKKRVKSTGMKNVGEYMRRMAIEGEVVVKDFSEIKKLMREMSRIGNNVNQITRKVNERGLVTRSDMKEVDEKMGEIWQLLKSTLSNIQ